MRKISEILTSSLERFEGGKNWIRGRMFDNVPQSLFGSREECEAAAHAATKFCAYGAICKDMIEHGEPGHIIMGEPLKFYYKVERLMVNSNSVGFVPSRNDSASSFEEVKALFCLGIKNALELEKQEPSNQEQNEPTSN